MERLKRVPNAERRIGAAVLVAACLTMTSYNTETPPTHTEHTEIDKSPPTEERFGEWLDRKLYEDQQDIKQRYTAEAEERQ